ncbi:MAG TPA: hypothetical protein DDW70_07225 [Rikenellaceae bacterium]|jgi:hypothetical protein|nr:hypothetical protein [Rikenellaceae bacterium]
MPTFFEHYTRYEEPYNTAVKSVHRVNLLKTIKFTHGDTETLEKVIDLQAKVSIRSQCDLLDVNRSNVYYQPVPEDSEDLELMRRMDEEF